MKTSTYKRSRFAGASRTIVLTLAALATLCGCANRGDRALVVGAQQLYDDGAEYLRSGNYIGAISNFENLRIRYPFAPVTRQANLDLIYAYYRAGQPEAALDIAETFAQENPRLPEVAYCLYMTGVILFDEEPNILERVFRVDVSERPPKESYDAFAAFEDLIRQFPDSEYTEDARQRMIFLRNRLAVYENHVARYYIRRGAYVAAINRAKYALEHYPGAPELEETLSIMIEAYQALGMTDLAADAIRVRDENFGASGSSGA
jgi:outer membrane protein assembly factor BamD